MLRAEAVAKVYEPTPRFLRPLLRTASNVAHRALDGVDLAVDRGEVIGLVGPNGAGKTTFLKMAATLIEPTAGRLSVDGFDCTRQGLDVRRRIGVVLNEERGLYWRLTPRQNLELFAALAGMSRGDARRRAGEVLELVGLEDDRTRVFGYSGGMRGRLNLARALLARPPLLLLDEPTRSLDPVAALETTKLFTSLAAEGTAVLLSSHRLDEVVRICDRVAVLIEGRIRFSGPLAELDAAQGDEAAAILALLTADPAEGRAS
jgi:ABC-2 type transport system ATP-binding protein